MLVLPPEAWSPYMAYSSNRAAFGLAPSPGAAAIAAARTQFLGDFAAGAVGRHHNTYQHRSRVLRQLTEASSVPGTLQRPA